MKLVQCDYGHYYDRNRHLFCPFCGSKVRRFNREMKEVPFPAYFRDQGMITYSREGSLGPVYTISQNAFPKYTLKVIPCEGNMALKDLACFEVSVMKQLRGCSHIVQMETYSEEADHVYILEKYYSPSSAFFSRYGLTYKDVFTLAEDICQALMECREKEVLQPGIQPGNIFAEHDGSFLLGDLDILQIKKQLDNGPLFDRTIGGDLEYLAPEVCTFGNYGVQSEIYSLGLILYVLLNNGRLPLMESMNKSDAIRKRLIGIPLPEPANGFNALNRVVLKACAFDRKDRYRTCEEFLTDIRKARSVTRAYLLNSPIKMPERDTYEETCSTEESAGLFYNEAVTEPFINMGSKKPFSNVAPTEAFSNPIPTGTIYPSANMEPFGDTAPTEAFSDTAPTEAFDDTAPTEAFDDIAPTEAFNDAVPTGTVYPSDKDSTVGFLNWSVRLPDEEPRQKEDQEITSPKETSTAPQASPAHRPSESTGFTSRKSSAPQASAARRPSGSAAPPASAAPQASGRAAPPAGAAPQASGSAAPPAGVFRWPRLPRRPKVARQDSKTAVSRPASVRKPAVSAVQFSAIAPRKIGKGGYSMINVVMYEDEFRKVVDKLIKEADSQVQEKGSGFHEIEKDTEVKIELTSPDLYLPSDEYTEQRIWKGRYLIFDFPVSVSADYGKKEILFIAKVYFNDLIATRLKFIVKCHALRKQNIQVVRNDILSAFISYASQDRRRVAALVQGMLKARPDMDLFFDVESLRSGENWGHVIRAEIEKRDILFLCWSMNARNSEWVEREWKYALERKGIDSIEPVPLDPPEVCPPPEELKTKHFNDRLLHWL